MVKSAAATSGWKTVRKISIRIVVALIVVGVVAVLGVAGGFYYYSTQLPPIGPLASGYDPPQTTRIFAQDGTLIGEVFEERRTVVPFERIPDVMRNAIVAAEDSEFWKHEGIDYLGIVRAVMKNVSSGKLSQGASTITQQVARTFFLNRQKSFSRKIKEALLTRKIERELSKAEILSLYLNQINFGRARYGVGEAARFYFDKDVSKLSLADAALLAGIPKGPAIYEPIGHGENARRRRSYVLKEMQRRGYISQADAEAVRNGPLGLKVSATNRVNYVPEVMGMVRQELTGRVSEEALRRGGYTVRTSIDMALQKEARQALVDGLMAVDARHTRMAPFKKRQWPRGCDRGDGALRFEKAYHCEVVGHDDETGLLLVDIGGREGRIDVRGESRYNPEKLPPSQMAEVGAKLRVKLAAPPMEGAPISLKLAVGPQGAVVVMDVRTGYIRAIVGSDKASPGAFNRASDAKRQPGSAFKPFVYLEALRQRTHTPASLVDDTPVVEGDWKPTNAHSGDSKGQVSLRTALAKSLNLPVIKLIERVGASNVATLVRHLGIESPLEPVPALALGASEVTPLEMAGAYATIAAAGVRRGPWIVESIQGKKQRDVLLVGRTRGQQVIAPAEAFLITSMMTSVIREGTGRAAKKLKLPLAGKTGTTDDAKDAWFVGYSPVYSTVVWVGYDEPRSLGRREYGARAALPIWMDVMARAHRETSMDDFPMPDGIVSVQIDADSGLLAHDEMDNAVMELFLEGTEPVERALPPDVLSMDDFLVNQAELLGGGEPAVPLGEELDKAALNNLVDSVVGQDESAGKAVNRKAADAPLHSGNLSESGDETAREVRDTDSEAAIR